MKVVVVVLLSAAPLARALSVAALPAAPRLGAARHAPLLMQGSQGPLEEGFKEILPFATQEGNVDQELVDRVDAEVFELMGVSLEDLLNPSKVVNLEREKILLGQQIAACTDASERADLQTRLNCSMKNTELKHVKRRIQLVVCI